MYKYIMKESYRWWLCHVDSQCALFLFIKVLSLFMNIPKKRLETVSVVSTASLTAEYATSNCHTGHAMQNHQHLTAF